MTDTTTAGPTAGNGLPAAREALVAQAERVHQEVLHDRDELRRRVAELSTKISGLEAQLAISELEASQQRSRTESAMTVRDEAISRKAEYGAVLSSIQAILRAFEIQNEPLVRTTEGETHEQILKHDAAQPPSLDSRSGGRE